jgi:hypothetical protein
MGTRADFYVGRGSDAEWIGSIAWDGDPMGLPQQLTGAKTPAAFREALAAEFDTRDDATRPEDGWPWPWENSQTTDYAYAFDGGRVWASCFGNAWFPADEPEPDGDDDAKVATFPDMTARRSLAAPGSKRSGLIALQVSK